LQSPLYNMSGFVLMLVLVAVSGSFFSNRQSIPCPSWPGWMVEMDNPIPRDNSAPAIQLRPLYQVGLVWP
jgi:hypothetical protein